MSGTDGSGAGERIGLLGGTFDPPHLGHLIAAQEASWRLGLTRVLFLPARQNPLKAGETVTSAEHRCRMVQLAIADNARFALSTADLDRPPPSYTVDLLRLLRQGLGESTELFFLVGADIAAELPRWYQPGEILRLATLVVVTRPGWAEPPVAELEESIPTARGRVIALRTPGVDITSTEIRARVSAGQSITYLTPGAVEEYVLDRGLYAATARPRAARRVPSTG